MDKAIYTTDEHLMERQPKNRTDDYLDTMLRKFQNIVRYCDMHLDIKHWFSGGDLFHTNSQNCRIINKLIRVLRTMKRTELYPILIIPGNHLIKGNADLSVEQSGLKTLEEAGLVKILSDPHIDKYGDYKIMMHHHAIVPEEVPWDHLTYQEIADTKSCDYCLCSHYHTPSDPVTIKGTTFVIPGALSRGTGSEKTLHRKPQFAVFTLQGKKQVKYVTCDKENYPFPEKAISVDVDHVSNELVQGIKEAMEGYDASTMGFYEVADLLTKSEVITPKSKAYLKTVYEKIS
jgi:DNA repair exonuclease SbcCD nuclease subunit